LTVFEKGELPNSLFSVHRRSGDIAVLDFTGFSAEGVVAGFSVTTLAVFLVVVCFLLTLAVATFAVLVCFAIIF
jgi:hypothetical protein